MFTVKNIDYRRQVEQHRHMHPTRLSSFTLATFSIALAACNATAPDNTATIDRTDRTVTAGAVLDAFAKQDWTALAALSSAAGVRFTPQTHVRVESDRTLTPDDIARFGDDETVYTWGIQDGSGLPIEMTNAEYLAHYVWDHDFRTTPDIRWNTVQDRGNTIDNAREIYPSASIVEYHFDGFNPEYGGMDWRSLRLVLDQNTQDEWQLVGIIHDEWTP